MKSTALVYSLLVCFLILVYNANSQTTQQPPDPVALQKLEAALESGQYEISYYNTACYFALAGKSSLALTYLSKAINEGFSNAKVLQEDTDLLSLHNDPMWASLVKIVEDNAARKQKSSALFFNKKSFWEPGILETPYQPNISEDEKIAGLSKLWSEVKYNFVNFDLIPDVNLDSVYAVYLRKVRQTSSTLEYYLLLEQFAATLRDGHTNAYMPRELVDSVYARPLLRTRMVEDKVLVVGVYDPALRQKGITTGQEIVTVNGLPVKEYASKFVMPSQSASTPQDRIVRTYDYALLRGALHQPVKLTLRDQANKITEHTVSRVKPSDRSQKMSVPAFEYRMLPGNIAYVALNTFGNDSTAINFAAKFEEISKASAIIFDVRNNGGGSTSPGWDILSYLIDKPIEVHSSYTREYRPTYRAWDRKQEITVSKSSISPKRKFLYTKPVVVLTSPRTFSAAEDFAAAFKTMGRGLIIGDFTGGSSGQPLLVTLPGNGSARICTKRDMLGNGEDFVGKGIKPDKLVTPTIQDLRKGIDTELQAAIAALRGK